MSKITLFVEAESLQEALDMINGSKPVSVWNVQLGDARAPEAEPGAASAVPTTEAKPEVPITQVRAAMFELKKAKGAAVAAAILEQHGAATLSELPPEKYADVLAAAEEARR